MTALGLIVILEGTMFTDIGIAEWLTLAVRYGHGIAAVAWLGGSLFHAFALTPLVAAYPQQMGPAMSLIKPAYREMVDISVAVLIVTGLILMFSRIQSSEASIAWAIVLSVKIALAVWMFYVVWRRRRTTGDTSQPEGFASRTLGYNWLLGAGLVVFMLAGVLREIVESALA